MSNEDPLKPFVDGLKAEAWDDIPKDSPPPNKPSSDIVLQSTQPVRDSVQVPEIEALPDPESFMEWGDPSIQIKLPDYCVEGLLPVGGKMILGGGSKSYKTWQLIDLALSVSHGVPWMGLPTSKGKVLYIDLEFIPAYLKTRIRGVADQKGLSPTDNLHVWHLRAKEYNPTVILQVMQSWEHFKDYSLIVIDPFYKMNAGGDENANGEVTNLLLKIEKFANHSAVVFAHHYAKGDMTSRDPIDRCAGAGSFARDPDSIISCTRHEVDKALTIDMAIRNDKAIPSFVVRFDESKLCMVKEPDLDPNKLHKPGQEPKTLEDSLGDRAKTLEALSSRCEDHPHSREMLLQVATGAGWTRHEFDQALTNKAEVETWFLYEQKGRSSQYTPK